MIDHSEVRRPPSRFGRVSARDGAAAVQRPACIEGMVEHFDWTFTSHHVGTTKPDPAIHEHVIRAINVAPHRLLFLDDSLANMRAGRRAGMQAEHTCGLLEVREALRAHLPAWKPPSVSPQDIHFAAAPAQALRRSVSDTWC